MYIDEKASRRRQKEAQDARDNRAEIVKALSHGDVTRRELIRWGIFTAGGALAFKNGLSPYAQSAFALVPTGTPRSPLFGATKFTQPMPRLNLQTPIPLTRNQFGHAQFPNGEHDARKLSYHTDYNAFTVRLVAAADKAGVKLTAKRLKLVQASLAERSETAEPVIRRAHKPGKATADPMHGLYATKIDGKPAVIEYEPDSELRDTEQVPLLEGGGIAAFIEREVLPHAPDAWVDKDATKIGYEISFNRYFYKPQPLRSLADIRADIVALEKETDGLLAEIIGGGRA